VEHFKEFLAGFTLVGRRQDDNTIVSVIDGNKVVIDEWPNEITYNGTTFTLEKTTQFYNAVEEVQYG
jgi:hypothetical protein